MDDGSTSKRYAKASREGPLYPITDIGQRPAPCNISIVTISATTCLIYRRQTGCVNGAAPRNTPHCDAAWGRTAGITGPAGPSQIASPRRREPFCETQIPFLKKPQMRALVLLLARVRVYYSCRSRITRRNGVATASRHWRSLPNVSQSSSTVERRHTNRSRDD